MYNTPKHSHALLCTINKYQKNGWFFLLSCSNNYIFIWNDSKNNREETNLDTIMTGKTRLLGLIGSPVGHSGSPAMYNYSFQELGIDYAYLAFDTPAEKTQEAIAAMKTFNMRGMNVTMPCKTEAARYMDELSPAARIIGAVNTIVNDGGKLTGYITDGEGFVRNLQEHGVDVHHKKLVIFGAGGAATAIYVQCALDGAGSISVFNVKDSFYTRAQEMARNIKTYAPDCVINIYDLADEKKLQEEMEQSDIVINATSLGMKPHEDSSPIQNLALLRPGLVVADVVYNPKETKLLKDAKEAGCICVDGTGMLLWQGVAAFKLYTGQDMPVAKVQERYFK